MSDTDDWVSDVLAAHEGPAMPEPVTERLETTIRAEVQRRRSGVQADEEKLAREQLERRLDIGSFGANAPSHFDKRGLGIMTNEDTTA